MKGKKLYNLWMAILSVFIIAGFVTIFKIITQGHEAVFHMDDRLPWTLLIAAYIYFILTSIGLTFVASLYSVFGFTIYKPIVKRAVFLSILSLISGLITMSLELGNPQHMIYYFLSPNFSSPIFWMGLFYMIYMFFLVVRFYRLFIGDWDSKMSKLSGFGSFFAAIAAEATAGAVFGLIEARPTYFGQFMPIYFLLNSVLCGLAAVMLVNIAYNKLVKGGNPDIEKPVYEKLSKIFQFVIGVLFIFSIWRTITGLYANRPEFGIMEHVIHSFSFKVEVLFGLIVPFTLLFIPAFQNSKGKMIAAFLVLVGLGLGRMDLIMTGQMLPIMPKITIERSIILYLPTIWEWIICMFGLALMLFLYTLGEKYLKLDMDKKF